MQQKTPDPQEDLMPSNRTPWGDMGRIASIGIEFVICIVIGLGLGIGFDALSGTEPIGTLTGLGLGITSAFYSLFRVLARLRKR
jgi:ATP synthase protein I